MIKLERQFTPLFLNPAYVKLKTDEFKLNNSNVWDVLELKKVLIELSYGKCAYCECDLKEESKYMEVEHFEDKKHNPDKVMEWDNLLPSCKRCNGAKSTHDVNSKPIINPFKDKPSDNLVFRLYKINGKTQLGTETVDAINLNHSERAVLKRFQIGQGLEDLIDDALERLNLYEKDNSTRRKNKLLNIVEGILKECQPNSIYSATCATILHSNENYELITESLKKLNLWSIELNELDYESKKLVLEIK